MGGQTSTSWSQLKAGTDLRQLQVAYLSSAWISCLIRSSVVQKKLILTRWVAETQLITCP